MKKITALLLACMMIIGMTACGSEKPAGAADASASKTTENATPESISLTVWGPQAELGENNDGWLPTWCESFDEAHDEWDITFTYEVCGEGGNSAAGKRNLPSGRRCSGTD